jgi:hypothetical protein
MKFLIQLIAIAVLAFVLELFLPWWSIAIAAFIGGYLLKSTVNFLSGFLAVALLWFVSAWVIDMQAGAPLAERVGMLFKLSPVLLMLVTALVGGLVSGFAAMAGSALRSNRKTDDRYYR